MGSFNTTCFASGQTIAPGDVAYLIPIRQACAYSEIAMSYGDNQYVAHGFANRNCYPHAFWEPCGGFIEGKYDDSGAFELVDSLANRAALFQFVVDLADSGLQVQQGKNSHHDRPCDIKAFVAENTVLLQQAVAGDCDDRARMFKAQTESADFFRELLLVWGYLAPLAYFRRLFAMNYLRVPRHIQFAVIHAEAYRYFLASFKEHQNAVFETALASATEQVAQLKRAKSTLELLPEFLAKMIGGQKNLDMFTANRNRSFTRALQGLGGLEAMRYPAEELILSYALDRHGDGETDDVVLFSELTPVLGARSVMAGLEWLNLKLSPMVYAGQDYANDIGEDFAQFVTAMQRAVSAQREARKTSW
jgi:hypothetical protein